MVTYGDMVTLVLTFFVLLFSFAQIDKARYVQIAKSLKGALGGKVGVLNSGQMITDNGEGETTPVVVDDEFSETVEKLLEDIQKNGQTLVGIELYQDERGLVISFKEKLFFAIGEAELQPIAKEVLSNVADTLREDNHRIRVEGHTCDLPINTTRYPSNWELSAARAINVMRFLIESSSLDPGRLSLAGYGPYRPIVENINEENRARNRRVDIVLLFNNAPEKF